MSADTAWVQHLLVQANLEEHTAPALAWVLDSACALIDLFDIVAAEEFSRELQLRKFDARRPHKAIATLKAESDTYHDKTEPYDTVEARVSYTYLRAHETPEQLVCRLLLEKKQTQ